MIADILSFIPLLFYIIGFILICYNYFNKYSIKNSVIYLYGLVLTRYLAQLIKMFTGYFFPKWTYKYIMRPVGASNCNYFSNNGLVPPNSSGIRIDSHPCLVRS